MEVHRASVDLPASIRRIGRNRFTRRVWRRSCPPDRGFELSGDEADRTLNLLVANQAIQSDTTLFGALSSEGHLIPRMLLKTCFNSAWIWSCPTPSLRPLKINA
jgi:hypothetical protein